jgi:hypothetical protein
MPAFAGMTWEGRGLVRLRKAWMPAFAGMTGGAGG